MSGDGGAKSVAGRDWLQAGLANSHVTGSAKEGRGQKWRMTLAVTAIAPTLRTIGRSALRLRRGETLRTMETTTPGALIVFAGDGLDAVR